jgi:adenosine deaminase
VCSSDLVIPIYDDRNSVREAQRKTIANTLQLMQVAETINFDNVPIVPVLHGRTPEDYLEHFDMYKQAGIRSYYWAIGGLKFVDASVASTVAKELKSRGAKWIHLFGANKRQIEGAVCHVESFDTASHVYTVTNFGRVRIFHGGAFIELDNISKNIDMKTKIEIALRSAVEFQAYLAKLRSSCRDGAPALQTPDHVVASAVRSFMLDFFLPAPVDVVLTNLVKQLADGHIYCNNPLDPAMKQKRDKVECWIELRDKRIVCNKDGCREESL